MSYIYTNNDNEFDNIIDNDLEPINSVNNDNEGKFCLKEIVPSPPSLDAWISKKEIIRQKMINLLGGIPELVDTDVQVIDAYEGEFYHRIHLKYSSFDHDEVYAYLLIPNSISEGVKYPAIVAMHQTYNGGKDETVGISGNAELAYGEELVKRGYVVLAPDIFAAGERIPGNIGPYETSFFYEKYPKWSAMGKMLYDHMQAVSVLQSLKYVDSQRIGAIGHSLGGHNAFFLAAFDDRVKAAVSSCGLCSIKGDPSVFRWSRNEWFVYFKSLRYYFERGYSPFEFHEVLALIAPRAFFNWTAKQDTVFPHWQGAAEIGAKVREVYELYGVPNKLKFIVDEGEHSFPKNIRLEAYAFLDENL